MTDQDSTVVGVSMIVRGGDRLYNAQYLYQDMGTPPPGPALTPLGQVSSCNLRTSSSWTDTPLVATRVRARHPLALDLPGRDLAVLHPGSERALQLVGGDHPRGWLRRWRAPPGQRRRARPGHVAAEHEQQHGDCERNHRRRPLGRVPVHASHLCACAPGLQSQGTVVLQRKLLNCAKFFADLSCARLLGTVSLTSRTHRRNLSNLRAK